ncbi:disease resistance protein At4g27190 isoform X2 [Populus trichocarpa]|uniref:disease resistance protein At4g27190 isoform X2 n=1 Tax=Populus trichocarpa TaxID=3694 RepID=UPI00227884B6|nr:disease resistance protein At4g27190 isoform X2 [Populus trichocarpa]
MAIESVGGSVVSKIAELLVEPAIKQFRYMFCFNNFVQEFDEQMMNLALAFYRLQDAVNVAERNAEEIEIDVNTWLENAKNEIEGVNRLQNEKGKIIKCFTWCPNSMRQFKLSKALAKKTETLRKLEENSRKFPKVSHKAPLQEIKFLPSKEFTLSGSSKEAFKQIMKALKDDKVNMIGLYGMGGVGKTTLVKEVGRRAKELHLFDEVLIATVSQNPNATGIQDQMADSLDLQFDKKSKEGRAKELWQRLQGKKMLIVLDDVWKDIDFQEIGIPFGDDHRGCKILLTTRLEDMCSYMKCKEKVFLCLFSKEEAWALFRINAALRDEDSTLNRVAKKVARECNGLPVALVTVGRALRDKSVVEWEVASEELKNSQFRHLEQIDGQKNAYACLKLSYDYLTSDETKSCFLLCCLFPEDYDIPIEDLTRYAVGYGLHKDAESIEDARKRVYVAIKNLKACCMLLGTFSEEYVKMHDLVRDVAIRIASSEKYGFMVKAGIGLLEWPTSNKSFEGCTTISLMGNKLAELPEGLVCPQLKVLLLGLDRGLNVPERFFEGMKAIEVLSLKGGCLSLQSLQFSTNLQSLLLIECECKDLIWLRKLQRLNILVFRRCGSIEELPDEIGELKELRLLDLTGCENLRRIPVNLIGRLKKLEELLIGDRSFKGWDVVGCDSTEGMNASLTELNSLSHLAVLSLKIPKVECIPRDFVFPRLLKYDIVLGDWYSGPHKEYPTSTRLYLGDISATSLNAKTFEQLFPTVSHIWFWRVEGLRNIVLSSDQMTSHGHGSQKDFFQRLEYVAVRECDDIRTLFPAKWRQALKNLRRVEIEDCQSLDEGINEEKELPFLTELQLSWLPELKCIWKGPTRHVSLQSLTRLELRCLNKLTFIFTPSLAQSFIHLETLRIENCHGLKRLIREQDDEIRTESLGFPKLKNLSIIFCDKLEYVFPVSVSPSLQNLEEMQIVFADNLKSLVFYSGEGDDIIVKSKIKDGIIDFPQLRELSLSKCSFFGPKDFAALLPSLQCLRISGLEEWGNLLAQLRGFTSLETLTLSYVLVPDLRCIWKDLMPSHLTSLTVYSCKRLTRVFTHSMIASLVQLQVLEISNCEELEQIIAKDNDDENDQILSGSDLQSSCFPNLWRLEIRGCNKLKSLFPVAMASGLKKLRILRVRKSSQLLGVFGQDDHASPANIEKEMVLPDLQELLLVQLPSISSFSLGCSNFLFPHLKKLEVDGCPKLTTKSATTSNDSMSAQSKAFMNLKEISIGNLEGVQDLMQVGRLVTNRRGGHELSLVSLETLCLNLLPDLRCIWKGLVPSNLTTLKVKECKRLTHVFTDSMIASLIQLQVLEISNCEELEQIIAKDNDDENDQILSGSDLQSSCFPNLWRLEIRGCNKLKSLFPVAMASGLKKLRILRVRKSSQLLGVFGQDDHASPANIEKEMVLPDLQELLLVQLPSISSLSLGCSNFLFPHLKKLEVDGCPKLTTKSATTSNDSMIAQSKAFMNLKEISIGNLEGVQDLMQVGRLVTNRRGGHELSLVSLKTLCLNLLPDLRCIWKGLVPSNLTTLKVKKCDRLIHVFTINIIASLVQLQVLKISNCEELEQIIAKDNDDENDQILSGSDLQSSCFPNLWRLEIRGCNKLKSLFPVAMASGLKKLRILRVRKSSQLLGVFGQDDHASPVNVEKEMVLPDLQELLLVQLPSIVYFSHGCYDFIFPRLWRLEVRQCPKLTTIFGTTANGSMSAQSEVSQVAEGSSTGCSVPTSTARSWTRRNGWKEEKEEEDGVR